MFLDIDRYIIHQFSNAPVRLIAVAPKFHRDNFTDRKYHGLFFQFWQFAIVLSEEHLNLQLKDVDNEQISQVEITYHPRESTDNIPSPPKALIKLLSQCELSEQKDILKIRHKILSFDRRMEEITASGSIKYGNGNSKTSKFCAELCSDSKGNLILFLWLPLKGLTSKTISRARVWTDWNDKALIEGYVTSGVGRKIASTKKSILYYKMKTIAILNPQLYKQYDEYKRRNIYEKLRERDVHNAWQAYKKITNSQLVIYEELRCLEEYIAEIERNKVVPGVYDFYYSFKKLTLPYYPLDSLVNLSLDKWLSKV